MVAPKGGSVATKRTLQDSFDDIDLAQRVLARQDEPGGVRAVIWSELKVAIEVADCERSVKLLKWYAGGDWELLSDFRMSLVLKELHKYRERSAWKMSDLYNIALGCLLERWIKRKLSDRIAIVALRSMDVLDGGVLTARLFRDLLSDEELDYGDCRSMLIDIREAYKYLTLDTKEHKQLVEEFVRQIVVHYTRRIDDVDDALDFFK